MCVGGPSFGQIGWMFDKPRTSFVMTVSLDRCLHCGTKLDTGGCVTCNASRVFCGCGFMLMCGCGRTFEHDCPNQVILNP